LTMLTTGAISNNDPSLFLGTSIRASLLPSAESSYPEVALTLNRFLTRAAQIRRIHSIRNQNYALYENLYHKRHWSMPPRDELDYQVVLPLHTIVVNTAHAICTGMPPAVTVYPQNPNSERDAGVADKLEQWHLGVDQTAAKESGVDAWERAAFNQALYGAGVVREVYKFPKGWTRESRLDDDTAYPIVQHSLNPKQVYWEHGNPPRGQFTTVFYEAEMSRRDVMLNWGVQLPLPTTLAGTADQQSLDSPIIVIDWWEWIGDRIWHTVFAASRAALVGLQGDDASPPDYDPASPPGFFLKPPAPMPEYYNLPYHIFPFYETDSFLPHEWALSILYVITDIPHAMEILASRQMRMVEMFADPTIIATRGERGGDGAIVVSKSSGEVLDLVVGDDVKYLQWQGSPPDVRYLWDKFEQVVHELSFSQALLAQGSNDATGFRTALDRETSLLKIAKGLQNYTKARAACFEARAYAMAQFSPAANVPAVWRDPLDSRKTRNVLSFRGEVIGKYRDIEVDIKPQFPGDKQRDIAVASAAIAAGLWPIDSAMEYAPPPDRVSKEVARRKIVEDKIEFAPEVISARAQQLAAQITIETERMMAEARAGMQDPNANPAAGGMGGPGAMGGAGDGGAQDLVSQLLGSAPGPSSGPSGLPGSPASPGTGTPAGASPSNAGGVGLDNALAARNSAGLGSLPVGTTTPDSLVQQLMRARAKGPLDRRG
jgi:hypothetical protein